MKLVLYMHNTLESHKTWSYIHKHLPVHPLLLRNNRNSKKNTRACESSFVKSSCTKRPNTSRSEFRYIPSSPPQVDLPSLSLSLPHSLSHSLSCPKFQKKRLSTPTKTQKKNGCSLFSPFHKKPKAHTGVSVHPILTHCIYTHSET